MANEFKRSLFISSIKGEDDVLEFLKSLSKWDYNTMNIMGTCQEVLNNREVEIYIRTGFMENAYMTSNIFPQEMRGENAPELFEDDDLHILYKDIINEIENNVLYSHIVVTKKDIYV